MPSSLALGMIAKQSALLAMTLLVLFPIYFTVVTSLKEKIQYVGDKLGLPSPVVLANFVEVLKGSSFPRWFLNSTILTLGSVVATIVIASLAAFAFAQMEFPGRDFLFNVIITLMVIPPIVMLIPMFILMTRLRLVNTYYSAIAVYTGLLLPFSLYLLRNFFRTIPLPIIESARVDGCSDMQLLRLIILPLAKPALVALGLVDALYVWNELLIALVFLQSERLKTLMVGLTVIQGRFQINQPLIMAGMLIAALPMLLIYLAGQEYFVKGLTAGALKGE